MSIRLLGKKACGYREYRDCHIVTYVNGVKNQKSCARMLMQTKVSMHVETVALLSQRKADDYVEVELELDELDLTTAANLENDNSQGIPKSEDSRQPQCSVEKEKAIRDALEHFGMI